MIKKLSANIVVFISCKSRLTIMLAGAARANERTQILFFPFSKLWADCRYEKGKSRSFLTFLTYFRLSTFCFYIVYIIFFRVWKRADGLVRIYLPISRSWIEYYGHFATVTVPGLYKGEICGICGNFNRDPKDDSAHLYTIPCAG